MAFPITADPLVGCLPSRCAKVLQEDNKSPDRSTIFDKRTRSALEWLEYAPLYDLDVSLVCRRLALASLNHSKLGVSVIFDSTNAVSCRALGYNITHTLCAYSDASRIDVLVENSPSEPKIRPHC
jgi:hypothetical protein